MLSPQQHAVKPDGVSRSRSAEERTVNRYPAPCATCGARVPANGGTLERAGGRWTVRHLECHASGRAEVITVRTAGWTGTRNRHGRCEDAPCCGCCSF